MQNDKKNSTSRSRRVPSVEETTAAITAEQEREEAAESLPQSDKSAIFESLNQSTSSENMERSHDPSNDRSEDQGNQAIKQHTAVKAKPTFRSCRPIAKKQTITPRRS
jgi:hypothetical protein